MAQSSRKNRENKEAEGLSTGHQQSGSVENQLAG